MLTRNQVENSTEFFKLFGYHTNQTTFDEGFEWIIDPHLFLSTKKKFTAKVESGEWNLMMDLLKHYDNNDVIILEEALTNCIASFKRYFDVNALDNLRNECL